MVALTFNNTNQTVSLLAGTDYANELEINAEYTPALTPGSANVLPSVEPNDGRLPPLPDDLYSPSYPKQLGFNHLTLPRLKTVPTRLFVLTVNRTELVINGTDYGNNLVSSDVAQLLSGSSVAVVRLVDTLGSIVNPEVNSDLFVGAVCSYKFFNSTNKAINVYSNYRVLSVKYTLKDGIGEASLEIGDELAYFEKRLQANKASKYCGARPKTRGEAARTMAIQYGLFTQSYPVGGAILEALDPLPNESVYNYLQQLYAPLDLDVRCTNGFISINNRPKFNSANAIVITTDDTIEADSTVNAAFDIYGRVYVSNSYSVDKGFVLSTKTTTKFNGNPENEKAWFQGGFTSTVTTVYTYGDTDYYTKEELYGYIPTATSLTKAQVEVDPCNPSSLPVQWGVYQTNIRQLSYQEHSSGAFLIYKDQAWEDGKKLRKLDSGDYEIYSGRLKYSIEEYDNTAIPDVTVCTKDFVHVRTRVAKAQWELDDSYTFRKIASEDIRYQSEGENPKLGQTSYIGTGQKWYEVANSAFYDKETSTWVSQPTQLNPTDPPTSTWIRARFEEVQLYTTASLNTGSALPAPNLDANFCYTLGELTTLGARFLRDEYGLALSKLINVAVDSPIQLGSSVLYNGSPYVAYSVEYNQASSDISKAVLLYRSLQ